MRPELRLDETLGHWAARFSWAARGAVERQLRVHGLTPPMMAALVAVHGGHERAVDLAQVMGVDAAAVTRLLDRLAEAGWLQRGEMDGDRRCRTIHLSAKAKALAPKLKALAARVDAQLTQSLSAGEKAILIQQLKALTEQAEKL
jgi:MarR family transcriptional regulator for hemolysin